MCGSGERYPLLVVIGVDGGYAIGSTIGVSDGKYIEILRDIQWESGNLVQKQEVR